MKLLMLALLFLSVSAHATFVQIHFNRPVLNDPNVLVMTFYDDEMLGPYHVAIYSTPFGQTQPDLLYMTSHEHISQATQAHFEAMQMANTMFPNVESADVSYMLQSRFVDSIVNPTVERPVARVPDEIRIPTSPLQNTILPLSELTDTDEKDVVLELTKQPEHGSFKTFRKQGCKPDDCGKKKEEKSDGDDDELNDYRQIPDQFKSIRISATHISFFK